MTPASFPKPPLTIDQQIDLLLERGLSIPDREHARHLLTHINYYRLRAYWLPFEFKDDRGQHAYRRGITLEEILLLYDFDRELRLLLLDAIERVEISLRARWAHSLALKYGSFAHTNPDLFRRRDVWETCKEELEKEYRRSREVFAEHYRNNYNHLELPPIWVACELMALGHISRWLQNLKNPTDRQHIADAYELDEKVLVSFTHHLSIVRNHCAHHGRIWNRLFSMKMQIPRKKPAGLANSFNPVEDGRIGNTMTLLAYLIRIVSPRSTWHRRFICLVESHPTISPKEMGFKEDWRQDEIWRVPN